MKNLYETIIIFSTDIDKTIIGKYAKICQDFTDKSYDIDIDDIGEKKLAYEIRGHKTGYYLKLTWKGTPANVAELERLLRIDDKVIKFMSVKIDDEIDEENKIDEEDEIDKIIDEEKIDKSEQKIVDVLDIIYNLKSDINY